MKKFFTKKQLESIPGLYETEEIEDKMCHVKLFNPNGIGTWYIVELDKNENIAFGYADLGYYPELGYIDLHELNSYKGQLGIGIERDIHFKPTLWSEIQSIVG